MCVCVSTCESSLTLKSRLHISKCNNTYGCEVVLQVLPTNTFSDTSDTKFGAVLRAHIPIDGDVAATKIATVEHCDRKLTMQRVVISNLACLHTTAFTALVATAF